MLVTLALFLLILTQEVRAQLSQKVNFGHQKKIGGDSTKTTVNYENPNWKTVDVDFLSSYYEQDGDNSPVTGGIGTEQLTDFTQKLIVSIPVSPKLKINVDGGYDYYTSASTDKIDPVRSDDSAEDTRIHGNVGFTYQWNKQNSLSARIGGSGEYDYASGQGGLTYVWQSEDENTAINAGVQTFIDRWSLIYPIELRGQGQLVPTPNRQSHNLSFGVSRVLDKKTQISVQAEGVLMNGLLSTPFHRVYFQEQAQPRVEQLPGTRFKVPIGVRLNRYLNEWMVLRLSYRYYWDTWGVQGHTVGVELPIKPTRFLAITPSYRFHTQSAADYFAPYAQHSIQETFYTSDYDLSKLTIQSYGIGVSLQPAGGVAKMKLPFRKDDYLKIKYLEVKYAHYRRSTGLNANIVSFGIGFSLF